jgi:hypothetical protein
MITNDTTPVKAEVMTDSGLTEDATVAETIETFCMTNSRGGQGDRKGSCLFNPVDPFDIER